MSHPLFGVNWLDIEFDENIKLGDEAVANEVFSRWYNEGQDYESHNNETLFNNTGKLFIYHRMFIIIFLDLLANCHVIYKNMLTMYI